jgi:hypothetical protein
VKRDRLLCYSLSSSLEKEKQNRCRLIRGLAFSVRLSLLCVDLESGSWVMGSEKPTCSKAPSLLKYYPPRKRSKPDLCNDDPNFSEEQNLFPYSEFLKFSNIIIISEILTFFFHLFFHVTYTSTSYIQK